MKNRIAEAIDRMRERLAAGVKVDGTPIIADLAELERNMSNSVMEHFAFQNAQARAFAAGLINQAEAQTIYTALGEVPAADGWATGTDLATKVVITQVMGELVRR